MNAQPVTGSGEPLTLRVEAAAWRFVEAVYAGKTYGLSKQDAQTLVHAGLIVPIGAGMYEETAKMRAHGF